MRMERVERGGGVAAEVFEMGAGGGLVNFRIPCEGGVAEGYDERKGGDEGVDI